MRICIIDDNVMVLDALFTLLRDGGHQVASAHGAAEGIALVDREHPDVVLVDFDLPDVKGDLLARELRIRHPALPIIIASGYPSLPAGAVGPQGADAFLSKPFTPGGLLAAVLRIQALRGQAA